MMTYEEILKRLEEIKARAEKATPGPWEWDGVPEDGVGRYRRMWSQDRWLSDPEVLGPYPEGDDLLSIEVRSTDADFIAHARDDIPWLVGVVRQLVARLEKLEAVFAAAQVVTEQAQLQFGWEDLVDMGEFADALERLCRALAAVEEGEQDGIRGEFAV